MVPVLMMTGTFLKKAQWFKDKNIPLLLGAAGVALALIHVLSSVNVYTVQQVLSAVFTALTQGLCCAGVSVYMHQTVKQRHKRE